MLGTIPKKVLITTLLILMLGIVVRASAPYLLKWYVNRAIDSSPAISGSIGDVDLSIIAGAYSVKAVSISQLGHGSSYPLLSIERLELSILWSALLRGKLVTEMEFIKPVISLYSRPQDKIIESDAVLSEKTWIGLANNLVPFSIDSLTVVNGTFIFDAKNQLKKSQFALEEINGVATNIANSQSASTYAQIEFQGKIQNQALITLHSKFDPNTQKPTFDLNLGMEKLPVSYLDELIKFYAPFDLEAGEIDLTTELKAQRGNIEGYVKIGVYDLDVFSWHEDVTEDSDGLLRLVSEAVGAMFSSLLENPSKDLIATRIPIEGTFDDPEVSAFQALIGILRNAFIEAYDLSIEDSIQGLPTEKKASTDS